MNILLTNSCNRKCPYCFAQERISYGKDLLTEKNWPRKAPGRISRNNFKKAIEFAVNNNQEMVGLLGGEPSVHPEFLNLLEDAWNKNLQTTIFTNGLWKEKTIDEFSKALKKFNARVNIIVNINEPDITPSKERELQERILTRLAPYCALSFNIYREEFNPLFLVDLITKYKCRKHIRLGIAVPLANQNSQFIAIERYPFISEKIMQLAEKCDSHDVTIGFDCGFILCMFNEEQLGKLYLYGATFKSSCGAPIDVGTDLSVWACFPLSTFAQGYRLSDYKNINDLNDSFKKQFGRLYDAGALNECINCKFRRRKQCTGGCASHVYRRFHHEQN